MTDAAFGAEGLCPVDNFFEELYPWPERITAVGPGDFARFRAAFPEVRFVQGDGRRLPFCEHEFDVAVSNAVVEHVGGREEQREFVHELCRVAKHVFVATPNRWFPVEVHALVPFVHWLPKRRADAIFRVLGKGGVTDVHLVGPRDFRALFPYPVELVNTGLNLIAIGPA
ncbi:MAG: class I SAM-dependent methyltransferase [Gaiellaceae bacterium]